MWSFKRRRPLFWRTFLQNGLKINSTCLLNVKNIVPKHTEITLNKKMIFEKKKKIGFVFEKVSLTLRQKTIVYYATYISWEIPMWLQYLTYFLDGRVMIVERSYWCCWHLFSIPPPRNNIIRVVSEGHHFRVSNPLSSVLSLCNTWYFAYIDIFTLERLVILLN